MILRMMISLKMNIVKNKNNNKNKIKLRQKISLQKNKIAKI